MSGGGILAGVGVVLLIGALVLLSLFGWVSGTYNTLVQKDVTVENQWAHVQSAYQRRADLIPNLVDTVKEAKNFEKDTQTQIAQLRSQAGQAKIDVGSAQSIEQLQAASTQMSSVLSRLMVIVEAYPDLKSNANFLALQDEISGTENRIKWERDNYNNAVQDYKVSVRTFPTNLLASMFGFSQEKWKMFDAAPGAETAPNVGERFKQ
jgi:LemA protein